MIQFKKLNEDIEPLEFIASYKINEEEEKLLIAKQDEATRTFEAYAKNVEDAKKVDRDRLISFIENYSKEEDLRKRTIEKTKELNSLEKARIQILQSGGDATQIEKRIKVMKKQVKRIAPLVP